MLQQQHFKEYLDFDVFPTLWAKVEIDYLLLKYQKYKQPTAVIRIWINNRKNSLNVYAS